MNLSKKYPNIKYQIAYSTKLLFIGTNPSPGTYRRGIPFSNNKSLWYLFHEAGILPEDKKILKNDKELKKIYLNKFVKEYHLGLMNLVYRPTKSVAEIKMKEAIPGGLKIIAAIKKYHPRVVCFIGKGTYELFMQKKGCAYGWQPTINSSKIFVMHSPLHGLAQVRIKELKEVAKAAQLKI